MFVCHMLQLIPTKCRVVESWVIEDWASIRSLSFSLSLSHTHTHTHSQPKPWESCGFDRKWLRRISQVFFSRCPLTAQTFKLKNVVCSTRLLSRSSDRWIICSEPRIVFFFSQDTTATVREATREEAGTQINQNTFMNDTNCLLLFTAQTSPWFQGYDEGKLLQLWLVTTPKGRLCIVGHPYVSKSKMLPFTQIGFKQFGWTGSISFLLND